MRRVSVVIPTYERPRNLARCLESLAAADRPEGGVDVVVVDDGGSVPLDPVVARVADDLDVVLVRQDNAGPASARNAGARKAAGDLVAFTDDDCRVSTTWLVAMAAAADRSPDAMLAGRTDNALDDDVYATASEVIVGHLTDWSAGHDRFPSFAASNNLAVPAQAFVDLGGFDETFPLAAGEDRDLVARWTARGWPLEIVPDAVVAHEHAHHLRSFVRQHHGYGRGAFAFSRRRADDGHDPTLYKGTEFYRSLLANGWSHGPGVASSIVLAQVAGAAGYVRESVRARRATP